MTTETEDQSPKLAQVLNEYAEAAFKALNAGQPGRVEKYDNGTQLATVKPLTRRPYADENGVIQYESLPPIPNVPVMMPGANGFRITLPVAVGDFVWLAHADRSMDEWQAGNGMEVSPAFLETHNLTDCVAFLGLHPNSSPWTGARTDALTFGKDGGAQVHVEASAIKLGSQSASEAVIKGDAFVTALGTFLDALAIATPTVAAACTAFKTAAGLTRSSVVKTG